MRQALPEAGRTPLRFRVVRASGRRAIVEVARDDLARARTAWEALPTEGAPPSPFTARRTWGTLVGAKAWLGERGAARRRGRAELTPR